MSEPKEISLERFLFKQNNRIDNIEMKLDILLSNFDFVLNTKTDDPHFKKVRGWLKKEVKARHRNVEFMIKTGEEVERMEKQVSALFDRLNKLEALFGGEVR